MNYWMLWEALDLQLASWSNSAPWHARENYLPRDSLMRKKLRWSLTNSIHFNTQLSVREKELENALKLRDAQSKLQDNNHFEAMQNQIRDGQTKYWDELRKMKERVELTAEIETLSSSLEDRRSEIRILEEKSEQVKLIEEESSKQQKWPGICEKILKPLKSLSYGKNVIL